MGDEWDAEDFEPEVVVPATLTLSNKWEGEDEDDDVKDNWEDEEEEKKDEEKKDSIAAPIAKPKAKKLADKIAEKEKQRQEELEKKLAEEEAAMTPEERAAESARRQKLQEEADLLVALELLGMTDGGSTSSLDSFSPTNKQEFDEFCEALSIKIGSYREREEFTGFVSDLVRNICLHMSSFDIKNLKSTLENLCLEKQKIEKGDKNKKPGKGKGKAKLNVETDQSRLNQFSAYGDYDYDDFM